MADFSSRNLLCKSKIDACPSQFQLNLSTQASAEQITALINLGHTSYVPATWHVVLLSWAILFLSIFANTVLFRRLPLIEGIATILHVLGFFAFVIVLWCVRFSPAPMIA